jgi:hypothetical protein
VSVDAVGTDPGKTRIDVSYSVTSLSPDHDQEVSDFGAGFGAMLTGWKRLILG